MNLDSSTKLTVQRTTKEVVSDCWTQHCLCDSYEEGGRQRILKCTNCFLPQAQKHPSDIPCSRLMTIQQDATPIWTNRIGEDSLASCALICWLTAERQHCLFNVGRVKGHCIAFVRSAVEVTLSSGPSCCRQLGHATYIESNYPCQLITAQLVPSLSAHTHTFR